MQAAEKAWDNFYRACMENIKDIGRETQLPRSDAFHLCMKVFQRLIYINYSEDEDSANPNCSAMGEETLKRRW